MQKDKNDFKNISFLDHFVPDEEVIVVGNAIPYDLGAVMSHKASDVID